MTQLQKMTLLWSTKRLLSTSPKHSNENGTTVTKHSDSESTANETYSRSSVSTSKQHKHQPQQPQHDDSTCTKNSHLRPLQPLEQPASSTTTTTDTTSIAGDKTPRRTNPIHRSIQRLHDYQAKNKSVPLKSSPTNTDETIGDAKKNVRNGELQVLDESEEFQGDNSNNKQRKQNELQLPRPRVGRMMVMQGVSKQTSIRDLSKYAGVVDRSTRRELTLDETHELIPGMLGFKSALSLINKERVQQGRTRLKRSVYLDKLCHAHALTMATAGPGAKGMLVHSVESTKELKELVNSEDAGENIQRGPSVESMHTEAMSKPGRSAYKNIMGAKFEEFGMGTAVGSDGKLYMAQLFRGKLKNPLQAKDGDLTNTGVVSEFIQRASFWTGNDEELQARLLSKLEETELEDVSESNEQQVEESKDFFQQESSSSLWSWSPFARNRTETNETFSTLSSEGDVYDSDEDDDDEQLFEVQKLSAALKVAEQEHGP